MRHTFDGTGLIILCSCLSFRVWVWFHQTEVNVFYVSIRTTESYEFDNIRTAGVTGNATTIKRTRATILYVQPEMKFCSPPGHFHHEPPLTGNTFTVSSSKSTAKQHLRICHRKGRLLLNIHLCI